METLYIVEFQTLLRALRKIDIMAGVLLPGDTNLVVVKNCTTNGRKKRSGY